MKKQFRLWRDPITGRRMAAGYTSNGQEFQVVQYSDACAFGFKSGNGQWITFNVSDTLDAIVERVTRKEG